MAATAGCAIRRSTLAAYSRSRTPGTAPIRVTRYCRSISAAMGVGAGKTPPPRCPNAMSSALSSIPAVFAVSSDPFIVFTSNIFAILGLRSLYFLLAGVVKSFRYLKVGLAAVLLFVGAKMLVSGVVHVPIGVSLGAIAALIGGSILASVLVQRRALRRPPRPRYKLKA